jgi:alkaline phosphatase
METDMTKQSLLLATALSTALATPALAQESGAKNVILMISDGIGFNGWLAADYYQGLAGEQSYQTARPTGPSRSSTAWRMPASI